jgi:hypothetical protein
LTTLTAFPYSLAVGAEVIFKVIATNAYGDSVVSPTGNGALI